MESGTRNDEDMPETASQSSQSNFSRYNMGGSGKSRSTKSTSTKSKSAYILLKNNLFSKGKHNASAPVNSSDGFKMLDGIDYWAAYYSAQGSGAEEKEMFENPNILNSFEHDLNIDEEVRRTGLLNMFASQLMGLLIIYFCRTRS